MYPDIRQFFGSGGVFFDSECAGTFKAEGEDLVQDDLYEDGPDENISKLSRIAQEILKDGDARVVPNLERHTYQVVSHSDLEFGFLSFSNGCELSITHFPAIEPQVYDKYRAQIDAYNQKQLSGEKLRILDPTLSYLVPDNEGVFCPEKVYEKLGEVSEVKSFEKLRLGKIRLLSWISSKINRFVIEEVKPFMKIYVDGESRCTKGSELVTQDDIAVLKRELPKVVPKLKLFFADSNQVLDKLRRMFDDASSLSK